MLQGLRESHGHKEVEVGRGNTPVIAEGPRVLRKSRTDVGDGVIVGLKNVDVGQRLKNLGLFQVPASMSA